MSNNILIVDDSEDDRLLIKMYTNRISDNINIVEASDGLAAMEILQNLVNQNNIPAIILLDINMPRLNGHGLLEKLKEKNDSGNWPVIPVYMLTSSDNEDDISFVKKFDFVKDYLLKPLKKSNLAEILKKYLAIK